MKCKRGDVVHAQVTGGGLFPFDMLRYDQCWPRFETEARRLGDTHMQQVTFNVSRYARERNAPGWTVERWRSMGWTLTPLVDDMEVAR